MDGQDDKPVIDANKDQPVPTLDELHDATKRGLDEEDAKPVEEEKKEEEVAEGVSAKDDPVEEPPVPEPAAPLPTEAPDEKKVAIKAFDGKTHYFNNLEEVPDDFEPASYKELMRGVDALRDKKAQDAKDEEDRVKAEQKAELDKKSKDIQAAWDKDIDALTEDKSLPTAPKEREKVVSGVFEYIERQLKDGVVVDSFKEAYKGYRYEQIMEDQRKEESKQVDLKKQRGGMVQPGGTATPSRSKVISGPPPGVSLDDVHRKAVREL